MSLAPDGTTRRGTSNRDVRGGTPARRARRAWLLEHYASDVPGYCRCYRCGGLLYNPDAPPAEDEHSFRACWLGQALQGWAAMEVDGRTAECTGGDECHQPRPDARPLTVDRIIPGCQGGTYRRNNIRPACGSCNSETGGGTRRKEQRK